MTPASVTDSTMAGVQERHAMSHDQVRGQRDACYSNGPARRADCLHHRGQRQCPVRCEEPGDWVVEHRHPITVGNVIP